MLDLILIQIFMILFSAINCAANSANDSEILQRDNFRLDFGLRTTSGIEISIQSSQAKAAFQTFHYVSLNSRVQVLDDKTLRFTFEEPLRLRLRNVNGQESTLIFRNVDVRLSSKSMKYFRWLRSLETNSVLIQKQDYVSREQSFEEIISQSHSETLRRQFELGERMAALFVYQGNLSIGYVDFEQLQDGKSVSGEIFRVDLKKLDGIDAERRILYIREDSHSIPLERAMAYARSRTSDPNVMDALEAKAYVDQALARANPFSIGLKTIDGRKHMVLYGPGPSNVARPDFELPTKKCQTLLN